MAYFAIHRIYLDFNKNGQYDHASSEITSRIDGPGYFQTGRERNNQVLGRWRSGVYERRFMNNDLFFSKNYESSPVYGLLERGIRIKETLTIGTGSEVTIFTGRLLKVVPYPARHKGEKRVALQAVGVLDWTRRKKNIQIEAQSGIKTGAVAAIVAETAGLSSSDYLFDEGQTTLVRYNSGGNQNPVEALQDLADNEGGLLGENQVGQIILEDRAHRFSGAHLVSQATYGPSGNGTASVHYSKCTPIDGDEDIFNEVVADVSTYNLTEEKLLWTLVDIFDTSLNTAAVFSIASGATKTIKAIYPTKTSPANEVSVDDWTTITINANTISDGSGDDLSTEIQVSMDEYENACFIKLTNQSEHTAYVTKLKLYGIVIVQTDPVQVSRQDDASQAKYQIISTLKIPAKFLSSFEEAEAFCDYYLSLYKDERTGVIIEVDCSYSLANLQEAQNRFISDRITVIDEDGYSAQYFVENKRLDFADQFGIIKMTLRCSPVVGTSWAASAISYTERTVKLLNSSEVPDQLLWTQAIALKDSILFYCGAEKWNANISEAQFRAKRIAPGTTVQSVDLRTVEEGGTFADNGQDQIIVEEIFADWKGFTYEHFYGAYTGDWYWAIRLKNDKGWSNWTDGNSTPQYVTDRINTDNQIYDVGPAEDFTMTIQPGVQEGTAVLTATRPKINGNRIFSIAFQIRDATDGAWRFLDSNEGASETLYDGSEIDHTFNPITGELRKTSGTYGDAATEGGLLLIDVRQSSFDHRCCKWIEVSADQISGVIISGLSSFKASFALNDNGEYNYLRVKIVRHPSIWNATSPAANVDGFQGPAGFYKRSYFTAQNLGDLDSDVFVSPPFLIPTGKTINDLEARIWFENTYSVSDDEYHSDTVIAAPKNTAVMPMLLTASAIGDGANPPVAGAWAFFRIPAKLYIERVTVLADQAGTCEWDIRKCSYSDYPADAGDSIVASAPPALAAASKYEDETLTGWTRDLLAGDCLVFVLAAGVNSLLGVTINLHCSNILEIGTGSEPGSNSLPIPWGYWPMDEVSTFTVPLAPSLWYGDAGSGEGGRYIWAKNTFQIEGDQESLANGSAYGPVYIPPDRKLKGYWRTAWRYIDRGGWNGGGLGTIFYDDADALPNVRLIGFKIYTASIDGHTGIKGYQAKYRSSAGATVYGTLRGSSSGATENEFTLDETEYITELRGYYSGSSAYQSKIFRLQFVTNLGTYTYGDAVGTAWTLSIPAFPVNGLASYTFAGLYGSYADGALRKVGILYFVESLDSNVPIPDNVIGWNLYTSIDGVSYFKANGAYIALGTVFEEA